MSGYVSSCELVERVAAGNIAAIARLISRAEEGASEVRAALAAIYDRAGKAHVIGITGVPGSGKSTLVAVLTKRLLARGGKVAIIAVDPSSPYSGGSILGDRIRMSEVAAHPNVYIRSMPTRGALGGLAHATLEAVDILDVGGFATIIIETVGVGQDEVDIARSSHTTIVVSPPGLGDEIQAIKAGMLEIADIHVVSKCDRADANRALADLKQMLMLAVAGPKSSWTAPVVGVSAHADTGFEELLSAIGRHRTAALSGTSGEARRLGIATFRLRKTAETLLLERFNATAAALAPAAAERLTRRDGDPYSLATELVAATQTGWMS